MLRARNHAERRVALHLGINTCRTVRGPLCIFLRTTHVRFLGAFQIMSFDLGGFPVVFAFGGLNSVPFVIFNVARQPRVRATLANCGPLLATLGAT